MASLLPKLNPEFTGVNPKTGEYLSPDERKQVFKLRKRKLDPSKVFDKSAIVKVDKPQANMESVMKSIANIQETLQKISNFIITDAEEKKKDTAKENRQLLLAGEKEDRKKKEGLLEKVPERLKNALLAPVKAVGEQAKGILSKLMAAFELIFVGWLTDKGLKAIQAFMDGDKEKLKKIGMNVVGALAAVGGVFLAMNVGILALPAIIAKVIAVIGTVGSAILGFLLSPAGLIALGLAAGVGLLFGMKAGIDAAQTKGAGGATFKQKFDDLKGPLAEAGITIKGTGKNEKFYVGKATGRNRTQKSVETAGTPEQKEIVANYIAERDRVIGIRDSMRKEMDAQKATVEKSGVRTAGRNKGQAYFTKEDLEKKKQLEAEVRAKYEAMINGNSQTITPSNSNNISKVQKNPNLSAVDDNAPNVIVNNLESKKSGDQPLKSGRQSNVPLIATSNPNNFYSTFSQTQYGVVV